MPNEKRFCRMCKKALKVIGNNRKNGANSLEDWNTRKYHKSCNKLLPITISDEERANLRLLTREELKEMKPILI